MREEGKGGKGEEEGESGGKESIVREKIHHEEEIREGHNIYVVFFPHLQGGEGKWLVYCKFKVKSKRRKCS